MKEMFRNSMGLVKILYLTKENTWLVASKLKNKVIKKVNEFDSRSSAITYLNSLGYYKHIYG
ncbi:MAG: hypothetical protein LBM96_00175 [Methanobrevibacter sp.]|nr:hypothetical protein [Candidatus Methanoflexus mossambicus]